MRIGILSPYPNGSSKSGIADYTVALLSNIPREYDDDIVVFADRGPGDEQTQTPPRVTVRRCWNAGWRAPLQIVRALFTADVEALHVEYDIYLFGGVVSALTIPLALIVLRLLRRVHVTVTLHGVVPRAAITPELLRENGLTFPFSILGKIGFTVLFRLFALAANRVIALETALAHSLIADYGFRHDRIFVIPCPPLVKAAIPIAQIEAPPTEASRSLLYFGFASYYKGLPELIDAFVIAKQRIPDLQLTIVAGRHPRLRGSAAYEAHYRRLEEQAASAGIVMLDFLDAQRLSALIASCAALVLPYTRMYGASGPLATAIAARKPVLVSTAVYFDGADPAQVFAPDAQSCADAIVAFFTTYRERLQAHARALVARRNPAVIATVNHAIRRGDAPIEIGSLLPGTLVREGDLTLR